MQNIIKKLKFGNIQTINIRMYVSTIFMYKPYSRDDLILMSHKIVSSLEK